MGYNPGGLLAETFALIYRNCKIYLKTTYTSIILFGNSPDFASCAVRVLSSYHSNLCPSRSIFIHIHDIVVHSKHRSFINIPNDKLERGGVFEWTQVRKTRIQMGVDTFYVQRVCFLLLVVQRLEKTSVIRSREMQKRHLASLGKDRTWMNKQT